MAGSVAEALGLAAGAVAEPALGAAVSGGASLLAQPARMSVIPSRNNVMALLMIFSPSLKLEMRNHFI
jgi:hypothetical protein